ncbi:MAG: CHAD domain-containing protein [Sphingomonadales bacterium]|nr:CHAD domain-containing protein [Sphingomonadales bacterium]MBU3991620.1 CHAD domain-containing protein [Alphaproteobacteria bacterium]
MGNEVELKLELAADAVDELDRADLFGPDKHHALLHATYYDTADQKLRAHGVSLRIRNENGHLVQTVKASNGAVAGLLDRGEQEFAVPGWQPEVDERTPDILALAVAPDALIAQFDLVVRRDSFSIGHCDAAIEVALDRGTVKALTRSAPFGEVELELKSGEPAALFDLARTIDAIAPVRIGVLTKADRGYRLLGKLRRAEKAGRISLHPAMSPRTACTQVLADCLRQYRLNEAIVLQRRVPEAIHQARVALRRMRSAFGVFGGLLAGDAADELNIAVRNLARRYGKVRDLDILIGGTSCEELRAGFIRQRDRAEMELAVTLAALGTRRLTLDIAERIAIGPWSNAAAGELPLPDFAAQALERQFRRVRKHGRHFATLDDPARHKFRKEAKKLRYTTDFFVSLYESGPAAKRCDKFLDALEDLQGYLGEMNDLAVEQMMLGPAAPDRSAETARLRDKAGKARHALLECEPFWA